jgi:hypothetical protein
MSSQISSHDLLERPQAAVNPKLILPLGRGPQRQELLGALADRPRHLGWRPAPDRRGRQDQSIAFTIAQAPDHLYPGDCAQWLESFISSQIEARRSAVLDLGGVIWALGPWFSDLSFGPMLREAGMDVVAVHLVPPDRDSLFYLSRFQTIIQPTPHHHRPERARDRSARRQAEVRSDPRAARLAGGARSGRDTGGNAAPWLPGGARPIRIRRKAGDKSSHIPVGQDFQIVTWRRQMEENFAPVAGWLA